MLLAGILTGSKRSVGHGASVSSSGATLAHDATHASLATLDAMALLARETGLAVHVVVPRKPGVIEHARQLAHEVGVDVSADLMAFSLRVRFSVSRHIDAA
jgi:hypothetical protein